MSLTWTQKLSDQLHLAHVARKKYEKEKLKGADATDVTKGENVKHRILKRSTPSAYGSISQ